MCSLTMYTFYIKVYYLNNHLLDTKNIQKRVGIDMKMKSIHRKKVKTQYEYKRKSYRKIIIEILFLLSKYKVCTLFMNI